MYYTSNQLKCRSPCLTTPSFRSMLPFAFLHVTPYASP